MADAGTEITTYDELVSLVGTPLQRVAHKDRKSLLPIHHEWLAASPFCLVATSGADGSCDVSPKGDPAGFTHVVDDHTIAIPDRPGNRRVDGFSNLLANPHIGLIYLVPGRGDTLRINGTARLLRDAAYLDDLVVRGHRPVVVVEVHVEQVFFHCSKAFLRSQLWEPQAWHDPLPSRAQIAKLLERPEDPIEELQTYYGPEYARRLY